LQNAKKEIVTYDFKSLLKPSSSPLVTHRNNDNAHLGANRSFTNFQSIYIDIDTGDYQFGSLGGKDKIDDFFVMTDRLGIKQQDKMFFISPSQDWLELAETLTDEELNQLVDVVYDISEALFTRGKSSEDVNDVVAQLNNLEPKKLLSTIDTMTHLSEQAKLTNNVDAELRSARPPQMISYDSATDPFMTNKTAGDILVNYSQLIFKEDGLSAQELSTVNEALTKMDYFQGNGLIDAARLLEEESKQQFFDLLDNDDEDHQKELSDILSYIGDLTRKNTFVSHYGINFENGDTSYTERHDKALNDEGKKSLIENILKVANKTDLKDVNDIIKQASVHLDAVQSDFWSEMADQIPLSFQNELINIDNLLKNKVEQTNAEIEPKQNDDLSTQVDKPQKLSFNHQSIERSLLAATNVFNERHETQIRNDHHVSFSLPSRGSATFNLID
jgi:hypothetical protein